MKYDLDSLEVLDAVVKAGTFARAAGELHRTQSAVSYAVNKLESQLQVEIFDRSGHRAELTDAGRVILIRTDLGNVFALGNPVEDLISSPAVLTFDAALIAEPGEPEGP